MIKPIIGVPAHGMQLTVMEDVSQKLAETDFLNKDAFIKLRMDEIGETHEQASQAYANFMFILGLKLQLHGARLLAKLIKAL